MTAASPNSWDESAIADDCGAPEGCPPRADRSSNALVGLARVAIAVACALGMWFVFSTLAGIAR